MSGGTVTPPRDGDRPVDDELVAHVIPLRRRGTNGVGVADARAPAPEYTLFDEPGEPTPTLNRRDMWGGLANQLDSPPAGGPDGAPDRTPRPAPTRLAAPRVLAVASVLAVLAAVAAIASLGEPSARPPVGGQPATARTPAAVQPTPVNARAVPPHSSSITSATGDRQRQARERSARLNRVRALARASSRRETVASTTLADGGAPSSSASAAPAGASSSSGASDASRSRPVPRVPSVTDPNRCVPGDLAC